MWSCTGEILLFYTLSCLPPMIQWFAMKYRREHWTIQRSSLLCVVSSVRTSWMERNKKLKSLLIYWLFVRVFVLCFSGSKHKFIVKLCKYLTSECKLFDEEVHSWFSLWKWKCHEYSAIAQHNHGKKYPKHRKLFSLMEKKNEWGFLSHFRCN